MGNGKKIGLIGISPVLKSADTLKGLQKSFLGEIIGESVMMIEPVPKIVENFMMIFLIQKYKSFGAFLRLLDPFLIGLVQHTIEDKRLDEKIISVYSIRR